MDTKFYIFTHKAFDAPDEPGYTPLHVGRALSGDLGYPGDDTGDNISAQNIYFSELTGLYWVWKNDDSSDIVGTCHYRRYLLDDNGRPYTKIQAEADLDKYDIITTKAILLPFPYRYGYSKNHTIEHLDATGDVIRELCPEYYDTFDRLINGVRTYFGNMLICRKDLFDDYCNFLFTILFEVQRRITIPDDTDAYHKRVFGFISELLLYVYVQKKGLHPKECMVGMLGEKKETAEVKQKLAEYFEKQDVAGAKEYFLDARKNRPDILMIASDITGELHACMQIISTCEMEVQKNGHCFLEHVRDFKSQITYITRLNSACLRLSEGLGTLEDERLIDSGLYSEEAVRIALLLAENKNPHQDGSPFLPLV